MRCAVAETSSRPGDTWLPCAEASLLKPCMSWLLRLEAPLPARRLVRSVQLTAKGGCASFDALMGARRTIVTAVVSGALAGQVPFVGVCCQPHRTYSRLWHIRQTVGLFPFLRAAGGGLYVYPSVSMFWTPGRELSGFLPTWMILPVAPAASLCTL